MKLFRSCLASLLAIGIAIPSGPVCFQPREAPITALDHKADITDLYAFVSYKPEPGAQHHAIQGHIYSQHRSPVGACEWTQLVPLRSRYSLRTPCGQRPRRFGRRQLPDSFPDAVPDSRHSRRTRRDRPQRRESAGNFEPGSAPADSGFQQTRSESSPNLHRNHDSPPQSRRWPWGSRRS